MTARTLMVMGTGSDVGKSLIVAGLCRACANRGLSVAPFKPQNMSNNAAVTADGGEIGRAQALQARAARRDPLTAMNPVLLKPEQDSAAQIVVRGRRVASMQARTYFQTREKFMPEVEAAFHELAEGADLVFVEGAGSASEINLRQNDLANFGFAQRVGAPVLLVGDIERGGVIASLIGTLNVIADADRALVKAFLINKFRGDPSLFDEGRHFLAERSGLPVFGPLPVFDEARALPAEDALALSARNRPNSSAKVKIAVLRLARIANFDDFDALAAEPDVELGFVAPGAAVPRDADLVIIPGSKSTLSDLDFLRAQGWDIDIAAHIRAGGRVMGICGGYQMLGQSVADPDGLEGPARAERGLGWLDVETILEPVKQLRVEKGRDSRFGQPLCGYHMHMGSTFGPDTKKPFAEVAGVPEGAVARDGQILGTYLHGLFASDAFRRAFLAEMGAATDPNYHHQNQVDLTLDALAEHLERHLDLDALLALAAPIRPVSEGRA